MTHDEHRRQELERLRDSLAGVDLTRWPILDLPMRDVTWTIEMQRTPPPDDPHSIRWKLTRAPRWRRRCR